MRRAPLITLLTLYAIPSLAQDTGQLFVDLAAGQEGRIFIDGADSGVDAPGSVADVAAGNHMIQVKGACLSAAGQVDIAPGRLAELSLTMKPLGGFVQVKTEPTSAEIMVDGYPKGENMFDLPCGTHTITVSAPGYIASAPRTLEVDMGEAHTLEFSLFPEGMGGLAVQVKPSEAEIFVDGQTVGAGPVVKVDHLGAGSHMVEALAEGHILEKKDVVIVEGQELLVNLELRAEGAPPPDAAFTNRDDMVRERNPELGRLIAGGSIAAVGLGMVGGGFALFSRAAGSRAEAIDHLEQTGDYDGALELDAQTGPRYIGAWTLWVGGAAAMAGGSVLVFMDDGSPVVGFSGRF